jgi:predicted aldo/keto reductase-like oxidoreductase
MVDEGKKMIEEVNNMLPLWGDTYTKPKMIQKCNQMIKNGNKMIEESSKEHRCGCEKCINCYEEVEILKHKCYMHDFFCFSVYP